MSQQLFNQAVSLHQQGRLEDAGLLYLQVLAQPGPADFEARYLLAFLRYQQGRLGEALAAVEIALARDSQSARALLLHGILLQATAKPVEALAAFGAAAAREPGNPEIWYNQGVVLAELERSQEAIESFDRALAIRPAPDGWNNRGVALQTLQRWAESLKSFDEALGLKPDYAQVWANRGNTLLALERHEDAVISYDRALALQPGLTNLLILRGPPLEMLARFEEAFASYTRALTLKPDLADAWLHRGRLLYGKLDQPREALADFERALAIQPDLVAALASRAVALRALGRIDEALANYARAVAIKPDYAEALLNLSNLEWTERNALEPAIAHLEQALAADPMLAYAPGSLLHLRMMACDWRDFGAQTAQMDEGVLQGRPVIEPFAYLCVSQVPADLMACAIAYSRDLYPARPPEVLAARAPGKRIRLGYLSADFREHATAHLMAELFELHDRKMFEVVALDYSRPDAGPMRRRLEAAFDKRIDIGPMSDAAAARAIATEGIDILVNINGYASEKRMGVCARRPAPLQVNYLGYPGTLGADYIDYILADRIVLPESETSFYSEKVVRLPDSYQVNDRKRAIAPPPSRAACGLPETGFVFCNFNSVHKLTPESFTVMMQIMAAVPGSVLWLLETNPVASANLRREAASRGVALERLVFAARLPADRHLARLSLADLFLDLGPYNAHTTASDALWAGLPLLTLRGTAFAGRVGASLLQAVGLGELIAESLDEYEALALSLANEPERLTALRRKLAANRLSAPLFDTPRFTRAMEAAYSRMWEKFLAGEAPASFAVPAQS